MSASDQKTAAAVPRPTSAAGDGQPVVEPPVLGGPEHTDYYHVDDLLTDEQRALRQRVRNFMDQEVRPIINPYWERAEFPHRRDVGAPEELTPQETQIAALMG